MKPQRFRTSALFKCTNCGKEWEELYDSYQKAYIHAKRTGHKVTGEVVVAHHFN